MSWYKQGFAAVSEEKARQDLERAKQIDRFYVKNGEQGELVLVDDEPFTIKEHTAYSDGDKFPVTCAASLYPDAAVCCDRLGAKSAYFIGYLTVVDCTKYQSKRDASKVYQYGLKLLGAKTTSLQMFDRKRTALGSLAFQKFSVHRDGDKSPQIGSEYDAKGAVQDHEKFFSLVNFRGKLLSQWFDAAEADEREMVKLATIFTLAKTPDGKLVRRVPPFNYMMLLHPQTPAELTRTLAGRVTGNYEQAQSQKAARQAFGGSGGGGGEPF